MLSRNVFAVAVLALGARADAPASVANRGAAAHPTDVHVVNSVSDPVKTAAVGTTQVAGNVNASQSGAWNVGVTSMPTVSAAQSGPWTVTLDGAPAGEAARQPFGHTINFTLSSGSSTADVGNYIVPAGKRLVVEHVTAFAQVTTGQIAWVALHTTPDGIDFATWVIPMTLLGARSSTLDIWQVTAPVRFYELEQRQLGVTVNRLQGSAPDLFGNADFQVSTSGYLLDLP